MSERTTRFDDIHAGRRKYDRRRTTFKSLVFGGVADGRRRGPRRCDDVGNCYVDWYEPKLFIVTLGIFVLNCLDALFTLILLSLGAEEVNVFMAALLASGTRTFVIIKLGITAVALFYLVPHSSWRLIGFLRVRHLLYGIFASYLLLIFYQLGMLNDIPH